MVKFSDKILFSAISPSSVGDSTTSPVISPGAPPPKNTSKDKLKGDYSFT